ncbi:MAG TPA: hypothetical protein VN420_05845 [Candidatus Fimivivens sp.]|nr:hypothetical protein [Candidatus Fimivivens sp.]
MTFEHSSMHVSRLGDMENEEGREMKRERKPFSSREAFTTALLVMQLQSNTALVAETASEGPERSDSIPGRTVVESGNSVEKLRQGLEIREVETDADWMSVLENDPGTRLIYERIQTLRSEVPMADHEQGIIAIISNDELVSLKEIDGRKTSVKFSYGEIRKHIGTADAIYIIHTHPFTPEESSYGSRFGEHIVLPPSPIDLFLAARDTAWFPVGLSEKLKYVVVDDSGIAWRYGIPNSNNFTEKVVLMLQTADIQLALQKTGVERVEYFRNLLQSSLPEPENAAFELMLRSYEHCQLRTGKSRETAIKEYGSALRVLGVSLDVSRAHRGGNADEVGKR